MVGLRPFVPAALAFLVACGAADEIPSPDPSTPVILISIDTLRADRLPMYGYSRIATPHLDALRRDSILYSRAYSHCPLTLPSHATVFTGLLPADTGVRDNIGYTLPPDAVTLAERLGGRGYATGGAVSSYVLRKATGIAQGFDFWDDDVEIHDANLTAGRVQRDGARTIASATRWIAAQPGPFLFFLHLYEPHAPWAAPEPFRSRYPDPYDGEVAASDALVGQFLQELQRLGIYDRALIILFSDHGEGLGDHGEDEHGIFLYREAIHVPLLVKLPGGRFGGTSVETPAQLSDIFPTVLERTGTSGNPPGSARSLLAVRDVKEERLVFSESWYPRLHYGWSELHSLIGARHHFIDAPSPELYDVATDPEERVNVLDAQRRAYFAMDRAIRPMIRAAESPAAVPPEEAAKLAALGYLGSVAGTEPGETLPDPKERIGSLAEIQKAFTLAREGRPEQALAATERLLADNPRMADLWALKSVALAAAGREVEAMEAAREGLRAVPAATHLAIKVADLAILTGRLEDAEAHAELLRETQPADAHELLARVWLARGEYDRAEREAKASLAADEKRVGAVITLARIEQERGDLEAALAHLDRAQALVARHAARAVTNLHFVRGDVLARMGRFDEAERELRREIALFPETPLAYRNLAVLLASQGRNAEGAEVLFALERTAPTRAAYRAIVETLATLGDERGARYWKRRARQRFPDAAEFRS